MTERTRDGVEGEGTLLWHVQEFGFACLDLGSLAKGSTEYREAMSRMVKHWAQVVKLAPKDHSDD